jgi:hypothetical protein
MTKPPLGQQPVVELSDLKLTDSDRLVRSGRETAFAAMHLLVENGFI